MPVELKDELTRLKGLIFQGLASGMKYSAHGTALMTMRRPVQPFLGLTAGNGIVTGTPKAAWGMVKMVSGYGGMCCRVRRGSDNLEADIPFAPDGIVDTNAMRAFRGNTQYLYLVTLYDQTAGLFHATQATQANQPYLDFEYLRNGMPGVVLSGSRVLTIPSGMVIASNKNCAVWSALGSHNSRVNSTVWSLGAASGLTLNVAPTSAFSVQLDAGTSATKLSFSGLMQTLPNANGCVVGVNSSAAAVSFIRNWELQATRAALTGTEIAASMAGGTIGNASTQLVDLYGMAVFDASMTAEDITLMSYQMGQAFSCVVRARANIVLCGDSIVAGTAELGHTYNKALWHHFGTNVNIFNIGLGGQTMQTMAGEVANRGIGLIRSGMPNIAAMLGGTNDVTLGRTAAQMYADALTWTTAMKTAGFTCAVQTLYPRPLGATGAGTVTQDMVDRRNAYNDLVRANCGPGKPLADYCIDVQNELSLATVINTTDFPDGQHPVNSGYVKEAAVQASTLYQFLPAIVQ